MSTVKRCPAPCLLRDGVRPFRLRRVHFQQGSRVENRDVRESLVEAFERLGISIRAASHNADQWAEAVRSLPDLRPGRRKEREK